MLDVPPPPPEIIVVTGRALSDPISSRAFQTHVIDSGELRDAPSQQLDEILKRVAGLQLFRRSDSTSGHPTSQGVTLRALGGNASSRALLILDGVPQADPFGGWVNWAAYDPAGLESVSVTRGGGSVPYGSGALAGVIEMRSLTAEGVAASLEGGSRQSVRGHVYAGASFGQSQFTLDTQASRSDGFVPITSSTRGTVDRQAPYQEGSIRSRWITPLSGTIEAQVGGLAFVDRRDRGTDFSGNRTRGLDTSLRLVGRGVWQWSALAYAQWRNFRSSFASVTQNRTTVSRASLQDSVPSSGFGFSAEIRPPRSGGVDFRTGSDGRITTGESRELYAYVAGQPTRRRIAGGRTETIGLFGEASYERGRLLLTAGGRIDRWTVENGSLLERPLAAGPPTRDDHFPRRSGTLPTARAGIQYKLSGNVALRAAAYRGWRMPTLNELFRPFRAGTDATAANPRLKPEKVAGAEVGVDVSEGPLTFAMTAFANRLDDAIANVTLGRGPGTFPGVGFVAGDYRPRQNVRAIQVTGVEASGQARLGPWTLHADASLTDAEVDATAAASFLDGLRPAQTPKFVLSAGAEWSKNGRTVSLQVRHVGAQFEDDQNQRKLRSATTFDAFGSLPLSSTVEVFARGQNLLDKTVKAGIGGDGSIERATPRTVWIGIRYRDR
ncbi:TonB-dependent receptor [Sphingomonas daechungensis]|uniref:TonB-dependent receptor n=1 Tax=Sphingomonas daechungensis TaxID=1176646 RepID=UPI0031E88BDB